MAAYKQIVNYHKITSLSSIKVLTPKAIEDHDKKNETSINRIQLILIKLCHTCSLLESNETQMLLWTSEHGYYALQPRISLNHSQRYIEHKTLLISVSTRNIWTSTEHFQIINKRITISWTANAHDHASIPPNYMYFIWNSQKAVANSEQHSFQRHSCWIDWDAILLAKRWPVVVVFVGLDVWHRFQFYPENIKKNPSYSYTNIEMVHTIFINFCCCSNHDLRIFVSYK